MTALRPHARALLIAALVFVVVGFASATAHAAGRCRGADTVPTHRTLAQASRATLCLLNSQRHQRHMAGLRANSRLAGAAARHSVDMVVRHYFEHGDPVSRILRSGYVSSNQGWTVGENIAWGEGTYATPRQTVKMWMHSPPHRANILRRAFREIGIGIALGTPGGHSGATYTTDFGGRH